MSLRSNLAPGGPGILRTGGGRIACALIAALAVPAAGATEDPPPPDEPRKIGLIEHAERRLAQIDVTAIGPPDVVSTLTAEDFRIHINFSRLDEFHVDNLCGSTPEPVPSPQPADDVAGEPAPEFVRPRGSYLFYFDQPHLTMAGRQRSLDQARQLVPELVADGSRAMIVSNARKLAVIQPFTSDPAVLEEALERLENDRTQWSFYAEQEESRLIEVVRALNEDSDIYRAMGIARVYQKEERWRTDRNLRRLEMTLGQLVDLGPPKAVLYFADTMRSNPGEHYLGFFGNAVRAAQPALAAMSSDSLAGSLPFDKVVNEAAGQGIRFYTVQAEGLVSHFSAALPSSAAQSRTGAAAAPAGVRVSDAKNALRSLASETGGYAFVNGISASKIADRILADASCMYLISFDPTGFAEDRGLRVVVKTSRDRVQLRVRGRLVLPSLSARRTASILRAFGSPGTIPDPFSVRANLVPTDFDKGAYSALLQVSVPGIPLQGTEWDIGASIVAKEKVREEVSGRMAIDRSGVPVVLEREIRIKPGPLEIVSVAHEAASGLVASDHTDLDWPDLRDGPGTVGPIALLQPETAVFSRDGETRNTGSLAKLPGESVDTGRPTALVGVVCRGKRGKDPMIVVRRLIGPSASDMPPLELAPGDDRCVQVRDVVSEGSLLPGLYRYEIDVTREGRVLDQSAREFVAVTPEP